MANSIFLGRLNAEQRKALIERLWHAQGKEKRLRFTNNLEEIFYFFCDYFLFLICYAAILSRMLSSKLFSVSSPSSFHDSTFSMQRF